MFTGADLDSLRSAVARNAYPSNLEKAAMAARLGVDLAVVRNWFQVN